MQFISVNNSDHQSKLHYTQQDEEHLDVDCQLAL